MAVTQSIPYGPQASRYLAGPVFFYLDDSAMYLWTASGEYTIDYDEAAPEIITGLLVEHIKAGTARRLITASRDPEPPVDIDIGMELDL